MSKDIESAMIEVFDQLQYQLSEGVAVVTLNRPESMNSMSSKMLQELFQVFTLIGETDSVNVVIITGMGRKAFSAGLDLKELSQGVDVFFQASLAYQLSKQMQLTLKAARYQLSLNNVNNVAVGVQYAF